MTGQVPSAYDRASEWATVKVDDRGHVAVSIGVSASGQGHRDRVRAGVRGVPWARASRTLRAGWRHHAGPVRLRDGREPRRRDTGNAVALAAGSVKRKACRGGRAAARMRRGDVRIEHGQAFVTGAPMRAVPLGRVARARYGTGRSPTSGGPGPLEPRSTRCHGDVGERRPRRVGRGGSGHGSDRGS